MFYHKGDLSIKFSHGEVQLFTPRREGNHLCCMFWTNGFAEGGPCDYPSFALTHTCIHSCICVYGQQITDSMKFVIIPILHSTANGVRRSFKVVMGMTPPFSLCWGALPRILTTGRNGRMCPDSEVKQYVTKSNSSSVSHQSHFAYPTVVYTSNPH